MKQRALLVLAFLTIVGFAGCTSESGDTADGAIRVVGRPADATVDALTLESTVAADEYKWNMGDGRERPTGKSIEYVYGVANGEFRIELTTVTGGTSTTHAPLTITLGTGQNAAPDVALHLEWNWVQVGEEVTFAAVADDPDGDPVLTQWFCQRKSDIGLSGAGHHAPGGGSLSFGSGSVSVIPTVVLNGTDVPAGSKSIAGDFCTDMATSAYTEDSIIRGAFQERGIYEITMLAKDPGHPGVPATTSIYVTDAPRAQPLVQVPLTGTIARGAPSQADGPTGEAGMQDHIQSHEFEVTYPITAFRASISNDGGDGIPVDLRYALFKGSTEKLSETADDTDKGLDYLTPGVWTAMIYLRSGANVGYTLDLEYEYITDPAQLFEAPH